VNVRGEGWAAAEGPRVGDMLAVALQEVRRHPLAFAGLFATIAMVALLVGLLLPKKYVASTTLLVEENNVAPLGDSGPPPPTVAERAIAAREAAFSPAVMDGVLAAGGWLEKPLPAIDRERLAEQVIGRTEVTNPDENLIRIAYTDADPQRALTVTRRFADLIVRESLAAKARASKGAFEFLDSQVGQYRRRLADTEARLADYRAANPDAMLDQQADGASLGELRRQVDASRIDLAAQRAQEGALRASLGGIGGGNGRGAQIATQLAELQAQLDKLRLDYTDQHPDVVRVRHQMQELEAQLARPDTRLQSRIARYGAGAPPEVQTRLGEARGLAAAAASRVAMGESLLQQALTRNERSPDTGDSLADLTRDQDVNRELYQALLKRREEARVAMELDARQDAGGFRIQEPAMLPLLPSGLRLRHVAGVGLGLAALAPLLVLLALVRLDPRVRSPARIERDAGLPVLGVVPAYRSAGPLLADRRVQLAALLVLAVPVIYGLVLLLKLVQSP
jgi:polysaccharide chain length determinant protein (PEP-CTERM system associated)